MSLPLTCGSPICTDKICNERNSGLKRLVFYVNYMMITKNPKMPSSLGYDVTGTVVTLFFAGFSSTVQSFHLE